MSRQRNLLIGINLTAVVCALAWSISSHRYNLAVGSGSSESVTYWHSVLTVSYVAALFFWVAAIAYSIWNAVTRVENSVAKRVLWCAVSLVLPPVIFFLT